MIACYARINTYISPYCGDSLNQFGAKVKNIALLILETKTKNEIMYSACLGALQGICYAFTSVAIDNVIHNYKESSGTLWTVGTALVVAITAHRFAVRTIVGADCFRTCVKGAITALPRVLLPTHWLIPIVAITSQYYNGCGRVLALYVGEASTGNFFVPFILACVSAGEALMTAYSTRREKSTVIILNGTSSAGKTSIAKQIQEHSEKLFIYAGIDHFIAMLPSSYLPDGKNEHLGFKVTLQPGPIRTVEVGLEAKSFIRSMHRFMKIMVDQGFNLVLDEVLIAKEDFVDYLELFKDVKVLFVSINPPLEVAEKREVERGDRARGFARGFYAYVHEGKKYDLEIDSSKQSPEESAKLILKFLYTHSKFDAFESHQPDRK